MDKKFRIYVDITARNKEIAWIIFSKTINEQDFKVEEL